MAAQNPNHVQIVIPEHNAQQNQCNFLEDKDFDYSQRAQWLRAAVLGANDGLVSIASLMMGVGAVKEDVKAMVLTGFAGLFAGACSMAIGEFAAMASALAFSLGAVVPLLAAAFIENYKVRLGVVVAAVTLALVAFGGIGAVMGGTPVARSCSRVVVGGWMAMAITFGLTKLLGSSGLEM
ncbi:Vacuolar iron transporter-like protein 4 [Forsythia ovata]|uniref:Vacuolar iron transporter n=1 Tax=Forsythia ovata TaxID=205694 RepID=A0ABD1TLP8_9LAMI